MRFLSALALTLLFCAFFVVLGWRAKARLLVSMNLVGNLCKAQNFEQIRLVHYLFSLLSCSSERLEVNLWALCWLNLVRLYPTSFLYPNNFVMILVLLSRLLDRISNLRATHGRVNRAALVAHLVVFYYIWGLFSNLYNNWIFAVVVRREESVRIIVPKLGLRVVAPRI